MPESIDKNDELDHSKTIFAEVSKAVENSQPFEVSDDNGTTNQAVASEEIEEIQSYETSDDSETINQIIIPEIEAIELIDDSIDMDNISPEGFEINDVSAESSLLTSTDKPNKALRQQISSSLKADDSDNIETTEKNKSKNMKLNDHSFNRDEKSDKKVELKESTEFNLQVSDEAKVTLNNQAFESANVQKNKNLSQSKNTKEIEKSETETLYRVIDRTSYESEDIDFQKPPSFYLQTLKDLLNLAKSCQPTKKEQQESPNMWPSSFFVHKKVVDHNFSIYGKRVISSLSKRTQMLEKQINDHKQVVPGQKSAQEIEKFYSMILQRAFNDIAENIEPRFYNGTIERFGKTSVNPFIYKYAYKVVDYLNKNLSTQITQASYDIEMTRAQYMANVAKNIRQFSNSLEPGTNVRADEIRVAHI